MNFPPGITSFYDANLASRIKSNDALAVERNTQTILDEQAKMIKEQAKNDPRIKQAEEMEKVLIKLRNKPEDESKFENFYQMYRDNMNKVKSSFKYLWSEIQNNKSIGMEEKVPEIPRIPIIPKRPVIEIVEDKPEPKAKPEPEPKPEYDDDPKPESELEDDPDMFKVKVIKNENKKKKKKKVDEDEEDIEIAEAPEKKEESKALDIDFYDEDYSNLSKNSDYFNAYFKKYPSEYYTNKFNNKWEAAEKVFGLKNPKKKYKDDTALSKAIVDVIKKKLNIK
jgi:hypothetical protein